MTTDARDLRETDDDGFHEIQLSGKQLVFLCMATTVVSIVIFLCGVLVGRGVRPVEPVAEAAAFASEALPADAPAPLAAQPDALPAGQAQADPMPQPDAPPADDGAGIARADRTASKSGPKAVPASPAPAAARPVDVASSRPAPAAKTDPPQAPAKTDVAVRSAPAVPAPAAATPAPPTPAPTTAAGATAAAGAKPAAGGAIAVQVGALRERADADALARRLSSKGYAAYIVPPDAGTANPVYKVRVGNYTSPDEAARVKRRLEQEEKLKPWIIR